MTTQQQTTLAEALKGYGWNCTPPDVEEKPVFEVGKWYMHYGKIYGRVLRVDAKKDTAYWDNGINSSSLDSISYFKPATPDQIREHLVSVAKEKGFHKGAEIQSVPWGEGFIPAFLHERFDYNSGMDSLAFGQVYIYKAGQWAEIVQEKPKSVFDLLAANSRKDWLYRHMQTSGELTPIEAFEVLSQAIDKHNEGVEPLGNQRWYPIWSKSDQVWWYDYSSTGVYNSFAYLLQEIQAQETHFAGPCFFCSSNSAHYDRRRL